jgi:lipid A ethanolaminephosphotransferase
MTNRFKIHPFLNRLAAWFPKPILLIWVSAIWLMLTANHALIARLADLYPLDSGSIDIFSSLCVFFTLANVAWLLLLIHGSLGRYVLALIILTSAMAAFFMDSYGVIIDSVMLDNLLHTDQHEMLGLASWEMFFSITLWGLFPALWLMFKAPATWFNPALIKLRLLHLGMILCLMFAVVAPLTADYASFIREHRLVRMYANPTYMHFTLFKWLKQNLTLPQSKVIEGVARDARNVDPKSENELSPKHEIIIMVVGETARFDRFSLNGYHKLTNPRLSQEDVVSFKQVSSCGTSTGVSVPCMFSVLGRKEYDEQKAIHHENALDVLKREGVSVLWRDNNSDSKGVAIRMPYEDFQSPTTNTVCDTECRDVGMLKGLDTYIAQHPNQDILIVLHQMGNHGPEYYRRYPKAFEKFKPVCQSSELSQCSQQAIDNAYDNAILYTDYFLAETIAFLKQYDQHYETAMLYVADHGESLGEHGVYLHAAPYAIAPETQTHVPALLWLGKHFDYHLDQIKPYANYPLSHDDLFCTLLTAYEVKSNTCHANYSWLMQNLDIQSALDSKAMSKPVSKAISGLVSNAMSEPINKPLS